ncbi:MAG: IclR family transcriptional regulator [Streptosporangiaceae bacterium]
MELRAADRAGASSDAGKDRNRDRYRRATVVATPTGTQAVDRAARLVTEVVHAADSVTFTELAAATGLAKSTTSRLLDALERGGLVRRTADGRFSPGDVFVRYAWRGGAEAGLTEVARPFLDRLGEETGETVNLGVAHGGMVEQIAQVDSQYLIGGTNWLGRPVPVHCAALGKVLLAYGAAELPPGRLAARTKRTITSRAALDGDLRGVRQRGYAITDEELEPGLVAVAAPVFRDGAVVVAALSVSAPAGRLTPARLPGVAGACVREAAGLSAALGHRATEHGPTERGPTEHGPTEHGPISHGPTHINRNPRTTKEGAA